MSEANEAANVPADTAADGADPWAHRSSGMRCTTCMWYTHKPTLCKQVGRCRRHAPTMGGYPAVFPTDWCGDHKIDETKI